MTVTRLTAVILVLVVFGGVVVSLVAPGGMDVAHAQAGDDDVPGPPEPIPRPPDPDPPFDPDACVDHFGVYTCPGMEEIPRNDYTRNLDGACTGDEGNDGAQVRTCGFVDEAEPAEDEPDNPSTEPEPDPDPEDPTPPVEVTEITRTEEFACDAPQPQLDLPSVDWPDQSIHASPPADRYGITGLDTWVWADGDEQYMWAVTEFGEEGFITWARDGLYYPDTDTMEWGGEYPYEEAFWTCANYGFWYAEIVEWRWTLDGPETIVQSGGQAGSEPNPHGDGMSASAHLMPEVKGNYGLTLETVWNGSWGDTWAVTTGPEPYEVREIRSQLR